jgi:hypothetical protein
MSRKRLTNRGLPARVYPANGRYYYIERLIELGAKAQPKQQRHQLTRVSDGEAAMYDALAALLRKLNNQRRTGSMVALLDARPMRGMASANTLPRPVSNTSAWRASSGPPSKNLTRTK